MLSDHDPTSSIRPCPRCFLLISNDWEACPYCGEVLADVLKAKWSMASTGKRYCSQCGKPVEGSEDLCPHCSAALDELPGDFCTACGSTLAEDWKSCPHCGEPADIGFDEDDDIWPFRFPCPQCNLPVRNDWEACPRCGERLFFE